MIMSTTVDKDNNLIIITPPNTEAILESQRFGAVDREVGSFYASRKEVEISEFLGHFSKNYIVDVGLSYYRCKPLFEKLIANCSNAYKNNLETLKRNLTLLSNMIDNDTRYSMFVEANLFMTSSSKYLRIDGEGLLFDVFKSMIFGDIIEIVIRKINSFAYLIYLRPRGDVENWTADVNMLLEWIEDHRQ